MFDSRLQPIVRRALAPAAARLAEAGVKADAVTLAGFALGALAALALGFGAYRTALALIALNRLADGLDGALARRLGPTDRGAFLDIALDFFFYALIPLGFAFADPERNALAAATLLLAFVGTGSSFLAFRGGRRRARPESAGLSRQGPLLSRRADRRRGNDRAVFRDVPLARGVPRARLRLRGAVLRHHADALALGLDRVRAERPRSTLGGRRRVTNEKRKAE